MKSVLKGFVGLALLGIGLLGVGCGSSSPHYNVVVKPDAALMAETAPPTLSVDMIAVKADEVPSWAAVPMSRYWAPDSQVRRAKMDQIKSFTFGPGSMGSQTLTRDDPVWEKWKGADTLFVMARLPGVDDQSAMDPRRVMFPLQSSRWDGDTLNVRLGRAGLVAESQPKPETRK